MKAEELQRVIHDWVCDTYGTGEADNPSWDITSLANYIASYNEENNSL